MVEQAAGLSSLFAPESVAIVGASDDPSKWGNWLARQALAGKRPTHLVNARASTVLGQPTVSSLRDIKAPVGLAVIAVPAGVFEATVDDALAIGVPAIVGISAGLGESGPEGLERERAIAERVRSAGSVLLGPNCLGVFDSGTDLRLTSNPLPTGNISFISQSGNLSLELARLLADHDLGFSRFASLGNQADLDAADLVAACADHAGTKVIAVYCEDFRDGRKFVRAAREANEQGRPVVLLTVGASEAATRQAASHTASLVSGTDVVDAACEAGGIIRVSTPQQMADVLAGMTSAVRPAGRRLAVLTDGGGHAAIAADVAEAHGLTVPAFSPALAQLVANELPASATADNPVDVAGGGEQDITCFARVAKCILSSGEVDGLVVSGYFGGYGEYSEELSPGEVKTAEALAAAAVESGRALAVHSIYPSSPAVAALRGGGVPAFRTIEGAMVAMSASRATTLGAAERSIPEPSPSRIDNPDYWSSRQVLAEQGVTFTKARLARSRAEVIDAGRALQFPVVLKAMGLLHKSDAGGVILGLPSLDELLISYDDLQNRLAPSAVTVEEMADTQAGVELIVGTRQDARFGPVVMVGIGGVFTEVFADVATALAPVDHDAALALVLRLRGAPLLTGTRGRLPVDLDAAAEAVAAISTFSASHPEIAELEVNPLLVSKSGALALDARIITNTSEKGST